MCDIGDCFSKDDAKAMAAAQRWRTEGMRRGRWKGPAESVDDNAMFQALKKKGKLELK